MLPSRRGGGATTTRVGTMVDDVRDNCTHKIHYMQHRCRGRELGEMAPLASSTMLKPSRRTPAISASSCREPRDDARRLSHSPCFHCRMLSSAVSSPRRRIACMPEWLELFTCNSRGHPQPPQASAICTVACDSALSGDPGDAGDARPCSSTAPANFVERALISTSAAP